MLHQLRCERASAEGAKEDRKGPRFVVHRHHDEGGAHLDLRLEQEGYLMGFRVDGLALEGTVWATAKAPHPTTWLDQDGEAVREDEGTYHWDSGDATEGVLVLEGEKERVSIWVEQADDVTAGAVAELRAAAANLGTSLGALAALAEDGKTARERAVGRFCGLGRELDGSTFDEGLWRKTLAGERLAVVQQYLHGLEVRFDQKYPPTPVSRPEVLPVEEGAGDQTRAMGILRQLTIDR